ncbi:hypothetical protein MBLNU459_g1123t1 [Dothideomycetes sp. NU459]
MTKRKNLLLCLDAFGTIFSPKRPVPEQYVEVARKYGIESSAQDVGATFKKAFKEESKAHPDYGKAVGMGAEKWWTNEFEDREQPEHIRIPSYSNIQETAQRLPKHFHRTATNQSAETMDIISLITNSKAPELIHRFNSASGYDIHPDVQSYLHSLRTSAARKPRATPSPPAPSPQHPGADSPRLVIGVITNSDDRVPDVLESLGLEVGSLRHAHDADVSGTAADGAGFRDIDFAVMSYDVGHEKPDGRIFDAATELLRGMLAAESGSGSGGGGGGGDGTSPGSVSLDDWSLVYVGDEFEKDVKGAVAAGWDAVLVDREAGGRTAGTSYMIRLGDCAVDVVSDFSALKNLRGRFPLICG